MKVLLKYTAIGVVSVPLVIIAVIYWGSVFSPRDELFIKDAIHGTTLFIFRSTGSDSFVHLLPLFLGVGAGIGLLTYTVVYVIRVITKKRKAEEVVNEVEDNDGYAGKIRWKYWIIAVAVLFLIFIPLPFLYHLGSWAPVSQIEGRANEDWVSIYNGPLGEAVAYAMVIDDDDNIYVAGYERKNAYELDYVTIKYDSSGKRLWNAIYDCNNLWGGNCEPSALAVDSSQNVYVTGSGGTIKYDISGNEMWSIPVSAGAICLDVAENVYIAGENGLIKYNSEGNELWNASYVISGMCWGGACPLTVEKNGDSYVIGEDAESTSENAVIAKHNSDGKLIWTIRHNESREEYTVFEDIAVDNVGNVYVIGYIGINTSDFGASINARDYFTRKYDGSGQQLWVKHWYGTNESWYQASAMSLDDSGNVYVTGFHANSSGPNITTVKYDSEGNELWASDALTGLPNDVVVDEFGNVYITGRGVYSQDCITSKYDINGNQVWLARYRPRLYWWQYDAYADAEGMDIDLDSQGNVFIAGYGWRGDLGTVDSWMIPNFIITIKYGQ